MQIAAEACAAPEGVECEAAVEKPHSKTELGERRGIRQGAARCRQLVAGAASCGKSGGMSHYGAAI